MTHNARRDGKYKWEERTYDIQYIHKNNTCKKIIKTDQTLWIKLKKKITLHLAQTCLAT